MATSLALFQPPPAPATHGGAHLSLPHQFQFPQQQTSLEKITEETRRLIQEAARTKITGRSPYGYNGHPFVPEHATTVPSVPSVPNSRTAQAAQAAGNRRAGHTAANRNPVPPPSRVPKPKQVPLNQRTTPSVPNSRTAQAAQAAQAAPPRRKREPTSEGHNAENRPTVPLPSRVPKQENNTGNRNTKANKDGQTTRNALRYAAAAAAIGMGRHVDNTPNDNVYHSAASSPRNTARPAPPHTGPAVSNSRSLTVGGHEHERVTAEHVLRFAAMLYQARRGIETRLARDPELARAVAVVKARRHQDAATSVPSLMF
jgi:hypothetical protein